MWKKTLLAAAVTGFALSARAADADAEEPAPQAPPPVTGDEPVRLGAVRVDASATDEGLKAREQSSSNKIPLAIRETPQSVSVITRESLDARQVQTLGQALELSAGVTQFSGNGPFAGQPSFGFNQTTIRGIGIDDIYDFREDGFVNGSYFSIPDLAIYDRIEVVKGPNSITYGRGSAGGLINRVRKKPLAEAKTDVQLSAGSFDSYRADLDATGPLLGSSTMRGRIVAAYEDEGSFVRGAETQRTVLAPSLDVDLSPTTRLTLLGFYQSEDIIPNTGLPLADVGGGRYEAPDISRRQYNGVITEDPYNWKILSATAQLDQQLSDSWLATLRLNSSNIDTPLRVDAYVYKFFDGDDPSTPDVVERRGDTYVLGNDFAIDRDVWSGELQITGDFSLAGRPVKAAFGADHNDNQYSRRGMYTDYGTLANLYDGNFERPDPTLYPGATFGGNPRSSGAYAQAQVAATDRLKVLLGLRYDKVKLNAFDSGGVSEESVSDTTGRIGLTYDISAQMSVYSLYSQSFTPELFATDINGDLLDPETGEIYEAGAKTEWFGGKLGINAAVYRVDRDNMAIGAETAPGEQPYSITSGLQRAQGFEVEINGRPTAGWDVSLAYNNVDSKFKNPNDPFYGEQPGGVADWQLGAYSAYELQGGPLKGFGLGATLFAIDDRGIGYLTGTIPGYHRVDLHAFYKGIQNVEINLLLRNITDERYIEGADRRSGLAQFGSPTAALLSLRYSLDRH